MIRPHFALCLLCLTLGASLQAEAPLTNAQQRLVAAGQGFFPVAQKLRDDRIAIVMRGGATHVGIKGRLDIVFSSDAGQTFTKPVVVVDTPVDDRNPAFGQAADGSLVVAFWRAAKDNFHDYSIDDPKKPVSTWVTRSHDGGQTWEAATEIDVSAIGYGSPYGKIILLPDQSLLMNVYGFPVRPPGQKLESRVDCSYLFRSRDNGQTWSRAALIGTNYNETGLLRLADGTLLAALRSTGDKASVWTAESKDDGATWSAPKPVTGRSAHPADLALLPDGRVLMTTGYRVPPFGVRGVLGDRKGNFDWEQRFVLVASSTSIDTGYPSTVVMSGGQMLTFYYAVGNQQHPDWGIHCGVIDYQIPPPPVLP